MNTEERPELTTGFDAQKIQTLASRRIGSTRLDWLALLGVMAVTDIALLYLALRMAYSIRYLSEWSIFQIGIPPAVDYSGFNLLIMPVWFIIFLAAGLYSERNLLGGTREYALIFTATTIGMFINISVGFLFPDSLQLARGWVILSWLFSMAFILISRFMIRRIVYGMRKAGYFQSIAIIVGSNSEAKMLSEQLTGSSTSGLKLAGFVHVGADGTNEMVGMKRLGRLEELNGIIKKSSAQVVILTASALTQDQILELFQIYGTSTDIDLRMSSGLYEIITTGMHVREDGMVPLIVINKVRLTGLDIILKGLIDFVLAIAVVLVFWWLFLGIALAVRLTSPGPVIYRRRVMGVNGKQFDAFKFRTMVQESDQILESSPELKAEYVQNFKLKVDPRVTKVGKILRKLSLDELPQVFNIFRGEMSVVGPRMISPDELKKYDRWGMNLLTVKPGITGLWQVRGRSDVGYEERIRFDMYYIRNWSIWTDIQIILQTIPAVLSRRGAY